jgi:hypothetical protein
VGYRIEGDGVGMAYLPDHEPALAGLTAGPAWTSGFDLARDVDLLLAASIRTRSTAGESVGDTAASPTPLSWPTWSGFESSC